MCCGQDVNGKLFRDIFLVYQRDPCSISSLESSVFVKIVRSMLRYYGRTRHIRWTWQSAKLGGKIHILINFLELIIMKNGTSKL